jgi:divalent metal cation (Fe/Co/Zn/Cd) transporter
MNAEKKDTNAHDLLSPEYYTPDKLLDVFKNTNFGRAVVFAIIAHIVFIFVFSISYLLDVTFPERVKDRQAKALLSQTGEVNSAAINTNQIGSASSSSATTAAPSNINKEAALLEQHKNKEVVKEITQKADPKDIPAQPDTLSLFDDK